MASPADYSRFGPELRRVRAGERAEEGGGKKVWHQAGGDVEVLSHVDAAGRVTRQECHLGATAVVWRAGLPITTGTTGAEPRQLGVSPSTTLASHAEPSRAAVLQALTLLRAAPAGDKYLDHFRAELERALEGLGEEAEDTVTAMAQRPAALPAPAPKRSWAVAAATALAVVIGGALALWLLR